MKLIANMIGSALDSMFILALLGFLAIHYLGKDKASPLAQASGTYSTEQVSLIGESRDVTGAFVEPIQITGAENRIIPNGQPARADSTDISQQAGLTTQGLLGASEILGFDMKTDAPELKKQLPDGQSLRKAFNGVVTMLESVGVIEREPNLASR